MHLPPIRTGALGRAPGPARAHRRAASAQRFFRQTLADPPAQEVTAEFLFSESGGLDPRKGTAWKVHFARGLHKGLYITGAWFKRDLGEDWIKILNDARIAELFVPYHQTSYIRYYDLTEFFIPAGRGARPRTPARSARSCRRFRAIRSRRSSRKCAIAASPGRITPTACAAGESW